MRILLQIEYDGTAYSGWQRQKNAVTVQEVIEDTLTGITGESVHVAGAGRTDAGVHALGQMAHCDVKTTIPPEKMCYVMNNILPPDIRIKSSREVSADFHVRKHAKGKHYRYTICNAAHASAIYRNMSAHVRMPLDVDAMSRAAEIIEGKHDFKCFQAAGSPITYTVRTIFALRVSRRGDFIDIDVYGDGFLYNMVRIIAGTLIDVGKHKQNPEWVRDILESRSRPDAGATAPAHGLTMVEVYFDLEKMRCELAE